MADPAPGVTVRLPRSLLHYWTGPGTVRVEGATLGDVLRRLDDHAPGLAARVLDDQGRVRRHVAVFVNGAFVDGRDPSTVPVGAGDQVHVVANVSGG